jgi:hypothetical protein
LSYDTEARGSEDVGGGGVEEEDRERIMDLLVKLAVRGANRERRDSILTVTVEEIERAERGLLRQSVGCGCEGVRAGEGGGC